LNNSNRSKIPEHVAIIMDGNGRWAKLQNKPRIAGHKAGAENIANIIRAAAEAGVNVLSLFAFSSENWARPKEEVQHLMRLFLNALQTQIKKLHENNIRVIVVGNIQAFSKKIQEHIQKAEKLTQNNTGLTLVIAANYGGKWDITQAVQTILQKILKKEIDPEDISEEFISQYLSLSKLPDPDLFIRTSGEQRISNFFLWQLAYSELYFTEVLWPDFDEAEFKKALDVYSKRQRRFGKLS